MVLIFSSLILVTHLLRTVNSGPTNCFSRLMLLKQNRIAENGKPIYEKFPKNLHASIRACYNEAKIEMECRREERMVKCIYMRNKAMHTKFQEECIVETKVTEQMLKGGDEMDIACFHSCKYKKLEYFNKNNEFSLDFIEYMLDGANVTVEVVMKNCTEVSAHVNVCVQVSRMYNCVVDVMVDDIFAFRKI